MVRMDSEYMTLVNKTTTKYSSQMLLRMYMCFYTISHSSTVELFRPTHADTLLAALSLGVFAVLYVFFFRCYPIIKICLFFIQMVFLFLFATQQIIIYASSVSFRTTASITRFPNFCSWNLSNDIFHRAKRKKNMIRNFLAFVLFCFVSRLTCLRATQLYGGRTAFFSYVLAFVCFVVVFVVSFLFLVPSFC